MLATALVPVMGKNGKKHILKALLDQGSETTVISEAATQLLQLHKRPAHIPILGIGNTPAETVRCTTIITFGSLHDDEFIHTTQAIIMKTTAKTILVTIDRHEQWL